MRLSRAKSPAPGCGTRTVLVFGRESVGFGPEIRDRYRDRIDPRPLAFVDEAEWFFLPSFASRRPLLPSQIDQSVRTQPFAGSQIIFSLISIFARNSSTTSPSITTRAATSARTVRVSICLSIITGAQSTKIFLPTSTRAPGRVSGSQAAAMRWANMRPLATPSGTFANRPQSYPPADFGPASMNLIAVETLQQSEKNLNGKWFEAISPNQIVPRDIYAAQLARRLRMKK